MAKPKRTPKSNRKNFRFTDQIKNMLEQRADELGISENKLTADALFNLLTDPKKFITCPTCKGFVLQIEKLPVMGGVVEILHEKCGTNIWFDAETNKILKSKINSK